MLIRFIVNNFLSFDEERELNMLAGSFKMHPHHVYKAGKLEVLKSAAMYGANGAGKSNLIKAMDCFRTIVRAGEINKSVEYLKFQLNPKNATKPISYECEISVEEKIFSYGFSMNQSSITDEWLYESGITKEDKLIFKRTQTEAGKQNIEVAPKYSKSSKDKLLIELMADNLLKPNELFLGKSEVLKFNEINLVRNWITLKLVIIYPESKYLTLVESIKSEKFKQFANELLQTFDTGVSALDTATLEVEEPETNLDKSVKEQLDNGESVVFPPIHGALEFSKVGNRYIAKKIVALHKNSSGDNIYFDLGLESDGTRRLLDFLPAFDAILNQDVTVVIDEIEQSLHPVLLISLIKKLLADANTKGQLIFTTHESNLLNLEIFRQDEIWFVEKNQKTGGTHLYSLSDFKSRSDLDIRKGYLNGRFGAVPFLESLKELNWHNNGA